MKIKICTAFIALLLVLLLPQTTKAADYFKPYINYYTESLPEAVAIGDVNGDEKNDVVMTTSFNNNPENDYKLLVFLQNSAGSLNPPIKYSVSGDPSSVDICDLNNDGKKDVVVGNNNSIEIFIQNQLGGLNSGVIYNTTNSLSIKTRDFNHDGLMDVAGIGWGSDSVDILFQNSNGTLGTPITYSIKHGGYDELEAGDVNNDGLTDVIVMSGQGDPNSNIGILYQQANGFSQPAYYSVGGNELTHGVAVGDINNDKLNDVIVSYGGNRIGTFNQNSQGTLNPIVKSEANYCPESVEVADVNSDGRKDVLVLNSGWDTLSLYLQAGNGVLMPYSHYSTRHATTFNTQALAVGDFNSDGNVDVAIADHNHQLVILYSSLPSQPASPRNLAGNNLNYYEANLTWDVSIGAWSYNVYRSDNENGPYTKVGNSTANLLKDTGLQGSTTYWYKVSAVNAFGESTQTAPVSVAIKGIATLVNITGKSLNYNEADLTWDASIDATSYNVYRSNKQNGPYTKVGNPTDDSFKDTGLQGSTTYWYKVSAVNAFGENIQTAPVSVAVMGIVAPVNLTVKSLNYNEVDLTWDASLAAMSYNVYRSNNQNGTYTKVGNPTDDSFKDIGLQASTTYWYKVSAVNTFEESTQTAPVSVAVKGMEAPVNLIGNSSNNNQVNLTWDASIGATSYNVYRSNDQNGPYTKVGNPTDNLLKDTGLKGSTTYWYKVSAVYDSGESSQTTSINVILSAFEAPSGLTTMGVSKSQILLQWNAVSGATKYNLYSATSQSGKYSYLGTSIANSGLIFGLPAYTTRWFKVSAADSMEEGLKSSAVYGKTLEYSSIAAPSGLTATGVTNSQINLKWKAVTGATKYNLYLSRSQSGPYIYLRTSTTTAGSIDGLAANTTYWYQVSALDSKGEGVISTGVKGKTMASSSIAAPSGLTATGLNNSEIYLNWPAVSGVSKYLICRAKSQFGTYSYVGTSTTNSYLNTGLSSDTTYWYKISAVSSMGEGQQSIEVSGNTLATSTIGAITELTAIGLNNSQINLNWTAVTGADKYKIYRATSQTGTYRRIGTTSVNSYLSTGLSANTTYWYKVTALFGSIEGDCPIAVSAKTTTDTPTGLTVSVLSSSELSLKWSAESGANSYNIYQATDATAEFSKIGTTTSASYKVSGLTHSTAFWYKITAVNSAGESPLSAFATTATKLVSPTNLTALPVSNNQIDLGWDSLPWATSYNIYRSTSMNGTYRRVSTVMTNSYQNKLLSGGTTYWYKVTALKGHTEGDYSILVSAQIKPNAPAGLSAKALSASAITLKWTAVSGATSYKIYQATGVTAVYNQIDETTSTTINVTELLSKTTTRYKVTAVNGSGESPLSLAVSATTKLPAPTGLSVTATSTTEIDLSWDSLGWATSYNIYRSASENGVYRKMGTTKLNSYQNKYLKSTTVYWYKIAALQGSTEGDYSTPESGHAINEVLDLPDIEKVIKPK